MNASRQLRNLAGWLLAAAAATLACGYVFITDDSGIFVITWPDGPIPMQIKLATSPALTDGTSLATSAQAAMQAWNGYLGSVQFAPQVVGPSSYGLGNGVNELVMDATIDGDAFGANVLAVTVSYRSDLARVESDIVFNTAYTWDSYRGSLQASQDIRRVAIHELGHVLGLDHPDQHSQSVTAIMNSAVSNIDTMQADDIAGAHWLYGYPGVRPSDDNFSNAVYNGSSLNIQGFNINATAEPGEPDHAGNPAQHSIWGVIIPVENGIYTLTTEGSNFDTVMGVYTGSTVSTLTEVASNDDEDPGVIRTSKLTFLAKAYTRYYVAVDGWNGYTGYAKVRTTFVPTQTPVITSNTSATVGVGQVFSYTITGTFSPTSFGATGLPSGLTFDANSATISGRPTETGVFVIDLSATNANGTGTGSLRLTVADAAPGVVAQTNGRQPMSLGDSLVLSVTGFSVNGAINYQWMHDGRAVAGATGSSLSISNAGYADGGAYWLVLTNSIGVSRSAPIFVTVAPAATEVVGWGSDVRGQLDNLPSTSDHITALAAGVWYSLGLKADGTVMAWGNNDSGQTSIPAGLAGVVAVAAGSYHALALKFDGTVVAWGSNTWGQTSVPSGLSDVVAIAAGDASSLALKSDGTIVTWGANYNGQSTVPAGLGSVKAIAAGASHVLALKPDGSVAAWGYNGDGQTAVPAGLTAVTAMAAGAGHSLALRADGTLATWGKNSYRELDIPAAAIGISAIAAQQDHSLALRSDGTVVAWGYDSNGETDVPGGLATVIAIAAGHDHNLALRDATPQTMPVITGQPAALRIPVGQDAQFTVLASGGGLSFRWRRDGVDLANGGRVSGATSARLTIASAQEEDAGNYDVVVSNSTGSATSNATTLEVALPLTVDVPAHSWVKAAGDGVSLTLTVSNATTYTWRHNNVVVAGATTNTLNLANAAPADRGFYEVIASNGFDSVQSVFYLHVAENGAMVTGWGDNAHGQLAVPGGLSSVAAIAAGAWHNAVVQGDGSLVTWGENGAGQSTLPAGLGQVVDVAAGVSHTVALKADGTVAAWGDNGSGQTSVPAGLGGVVAVSAGWNHTLALKSDETVVAWGDNSYGQALVPTGLAGVVMVAGGGYHSLALKNDGTVVAWGRADLGQCTVPAGLTGVVAVAAGANHSLALKSDGTVVAWGRADFGQCAVPAGLSGVVAVMARGNFSAAVKSDGTVVVWGDNSAGETNVPAGLGPVSLLAGGALHILAAISPAVPTITSQPVDETVTAGQSASFSVAATGSSLTYQWRKAGSGLSDGGRIGGATTATLTIQGTQPTDAGSYDVVVSNGSGSVTSNTATLTVINGFGAWANAKFTSGELADANLSGPNAVYGQDGLPNLVKYALGLEPKQNITTGLPAVTTTATDWVYTYSRPSDRTDITYDVE
ncbi:MAG TPA: immunoglobulin domain-containing protein, partial [Lacunisphaera sp.]|nr:immunoglobulin domain-containing protein [Lacunisphaera sp.]